MRTSLFHASALLIAFLFGTFLHAQDAKEIIEKMDRQMRGKTSTAELSIEIVRPDWTRTMKVKSWSKGDEFAMILVTHPAREEGTAFLKRGDEVWNWVPRVERTIKLPPSMMSQSWMGTDLKNDDLVEQASLVSDYHHELMGDPTIRGRECYKVKLTPKEGAAVVWGKLVLFVDKEHHVELRTEFYDETGELVNVMKSFDIQEIGGRMLPKRVEVIPQDKEGHKTVMERGSMSFNEPIEDDFFTTRNMKELR